MYSICNLFKERKRTKKKERKENENTFDVFHK